MLTVIKRVASQARSARRCFSTVTEPWDLFPTPTVEVVEREAPQYMMNMRDNLEFALERMRLMEGPVTLQLPSSSTHPAKKATHGKRSCSHHRRRLRRFAGRRSDK